MRESAPGGPLHRRPGLVAAIAALGKGDVLLVAKRDRIFRADPYECTVIERAVLGRGARIVSAAGEGTGDDTPSSVLMRRLLDSFGEYERLVIAARTRAVLNSKRTRGERTGQVPFGWQLGSDGKTLLADPDEASALAWMRKLRGEGMSLRKIAREMGLLGVAPRSGGLWSHSSIAHLLRKRPCD